MELLATVVVYITGVFLTIVIAFIIKWFVLWGSKFKDLPRKIPGPTQLPIFGNTFQFLVSPENFLPLFDKWTEEYGHRILYRVGTYWIVGLSNPKDIELNFSDSVLQKLLTSTTETVKSVDYEQLIPWLGTGLLISNGEKWSKRRKLLTPAFHFQILEKFMDVFNQQSFKFVKIIQSKYEPGETFDITPLISKLALDIICETAMGVKINAQEQQNDSDYIAALTRIKYFQQYRAFRPWLEPSLIWDLFSHGREEKRLISTLHQFTNKVIKQRKLEHLHKSASNEEEVGEGKVPCSVNIENKVPEESRPSEKRKLAFLDILLEALRLGNLESDEDVREETDTFMFEGHDTVSAGIAFTLFFIANHPDVQEKVNQELHAVFEEDSHRPVTMQDLGKLKYLECCIKESLRICPSVPVIARNIQHNFELGWFKLDENLTLPSDTLVLVLPYQLHRNTDIFSDPLVFRPERFMANEATTRHPFGYIPFSAGPRNCIGQKFALLEQKVVVTNVLRSFKITTTEKLADLTLLSDLILHSQRGINIKYEFKDT